MKVRRILIVDDEERIREVVRMCLIKIAKWDVFVAACGQDAITIAAAEQPDAILLDVSMPGINGIETLRHVWTSSDTKLKRIS